MKASRKKGNKSDDGPVAPAVKKKQFSLIKALLEAATSGMDSTTPKGGREGDEHDKIRREQNKGWVAASVLPPVMAEFRRKVKAVGDVTPEISWGEVLEVDDDGSGASSDDDAWRELSMEDNV